MNYKKIVDKYITDIQSGKIASCELIKMMIQRHLDDLGRDDIYFDEESATRFLKFTSVCKYTKGELAKQGKRIELTPQQVFRYWCIFGWKNLDGRRRFRRVYQEVARKNGKSEEAALVGNYLGFFDGEAGAEVYSAATTMGQARIVHDAAMVMMRRLKNDSPKYNSKITLTGGSRTAGNISMLENNSKFEPLPANDDKLDGLNPHAAIIDEYHAHQDNRLLEVIQTGMGSRSQPMLFIITTAGFEKQYPCYAEERKLAVEVLKGIKKDDSLFAAIFTLDEGDDWKDPKVWEKSNPNIGITPSWEYMEQQCQQALNKGVSKEVQFKTKNLNIWTDSSMAWINDDKWMACKGGLPDLKGKECYLGLDLAAKVDMNALVLIFPIEDKIYIKEYFWMPKNRIEDKKEIANFPQWLRDGLIYENGIDVSDSRVIAKFIAQLYSVYNVKGLGFDVWGSHTMLHVLDEEGINENVIEVRQGARTLSDPIKQVEALVLSNKLVHEGHPCMRWQIGNVELKVDNNDNVTLDKAKSRNKIDGVAAMVNAFATYSALRGEDEGDFIYDSQDIRML